MGAPERVGHYRLIREAGRGGLGVVYEAQDERTGARRAVKMLHLPDPYMTRRLEREFRAIARLDHPGLVQVHDYGQSAGAPYLVMDYVEGSSLLEHLRGLEGGAAPGPPSPLRLRRAIGLTIELCNVLGYVHGMGIVHRDLKPSNVLVDTEGRIKLIDFGLVKDMAEEEALTESGTILGTTAYLSPEQLQGRRLDGRADLYSLGVMLFELCVGMRPFHPETRVNLLRAHLMTPPPPPRSIHPAISEPLERLILRLLEKEPYRRPATAREVRQVLLALREMQDPLLDDLTAELESTEAPQKLHLHPGDPTLEISALGLAPLPPQTRLAGRDHELEGARHALEAVFEGQVRVLAFTGEAGTGKSRMIEEAMAHWRLLGGLVLQGRSHLGDRMAYGLLVPVLRQLQSLETPRPQSASAETADAGPEPGSEQASGSTTSVPGLALVDVEAVLPALSSALHRACTGEPVALFLEDLHWSDSLSLEGVQALLRAGADTPGRGLAVVLSYREGENLPEPLDQTLQWARRERLLERWKLGPLAEAQAAELIASLLGESVSPYFTAWLHRATGGNPALLEGAVRQVADRGALRRGPAGQWQLELKSGEVSLSEFEEAELPSALDVLAGDAVELALLKISGVGAAEKDLLEVGALLRGEFGLETLAGVLGLEELEVLDRLDALLRRGILSEANAGGDRFRFVLEMLRESVARGLTGPRRMLLHRKIVAGLERRYGKEPRGPAAVDLAEHAHSGKLDDKALRYGLKAASELHRQHLFRDAERLYLRVQELLGKDTLAEVLTQEEKLDALEGLANVQVARAHLDEALELLARLERLCVETGNSRRLLRVLRAQATATWRLGDDQALGSLVQRLIELADGLGDGLDRAYGLNLQASLAFGRNDLPEAERLFRQAVEAYRQAGAGEELAGALANCGFIVDCMGRYEEAQALLAEALTLRRKAPPTTALLRCLVSLTGNALRRGHLGEARQLIDECEALARRLGDPYGRVVTLLHKARLVQIEGKHQEAIALYRQFQELSERIDLPDVHLEAALELCRIEALEHPEAALSRLQVLLTQARSSSVKHEIRAHVALAEVCLALGQDDQARDHASKALESAHSTGFRWSVPDAEAVLERLSRS